MNLLNTLYVTEPHAYLHLDHGTVRIEVDHQTIIKVPLIELEAIVCFGNTMWSPALVRECAMQGRSMVLLQQSGRFSARIEGSLSGNVWLRQAQYRAIDNDAKTLDLAKCIVAGKLRNCRQVLSRGARELKNVDETSRLVAAVTAHDQALSLLTSAADMDTLRGLEGQSAHMYFGVLDRLVTSDPRTFRMNTRMRRPPPNPMNAMLSFLYTLLTHDCSAALESVGLDPQAGYLHTLRPGRPALALDLMEELRPILADRLALTLINLRQIGADDFELDEGGGVQMTVRGRKAVITAYQQRKREEVTHRVLARKLPLGLVPLIQARLLACCLKTKPY